MLVSATAICRFCGALRWYHDALSRCLPGFDLVKVRA
jgi:hypothetical protein